MKLDPEKMKPVEVSRSNPMVQFVRAENCPANDPDFACAGIVMGFGVPVEDSFCKYFNGEAGECSFGGDENMGKG